MTPQLPSHTPNPPRSIPSYSAQTQKSLPRAEIGPAAQIAEDLFNFSRGQPTHSQKQALHVNPRRIPLVVENDTPITVAQVMSSRINEKRPLIQMRREEDALVQKGIQMSTKLVGQRVAVSPLMTVPTGQTALVGKTYTGMLPQLTMNEDTTEGKGPAPRRSAATDWLNDQQQKPKKYSRVVQPAREIIQDTSFRAYVYQQQQQQQSQYLTLNQ